MKKSGLYLALLSFTLFTACKEKEEVRTDTVETNTVESVRTEPSDTIVVKEQSEPNGTNVKIGNDGVSVDSKDGKNTVDVNVK